jgi:membrane protein YqaA with SNARE-associated domain
VTFFDPQSLPSNATRAHHVRALHWFTHLGLLGVFVVAALDSSVIPLPLPGSTDLLLLWLVADGGNPWLLVSAAVAGSVIGGYTTWQFGAKGGRAALRSARFLRPVSRSVERHPILAVLLFPLLPPPIPLAPFVLASGALGVPRGQFLITFTAARLLRYGLVAWLAVSYGRHAVHLWAGTLQKWSAPILWTFVVALLAGIGLGIWRARSRKHQKAFRGERGKPAMSQSD